MLKSIETITGRNILSGKLFALISLLVFALAIQSCSPDDSASVQEPVKFRIPDGFPAPVYKFTDNQVTNSRFELGRKLFYDPILSRDNTISCGTCHLQAGAFSHIDHKVSHGIDNLMGTRNSPSLFNLAWHNSFFWDGGVNHIEVQPINPIQNPVEMDESLANVIQKLRASPVYPALFREAYGTDSIHSQLMLRALAQFMALLISDDSKYDKHMRGEEDGKFTSREINGLRLFRLHCESCHNEPLFTDLSFRNNGLDTDFSSDPGREIITLDPADAGKFKVPSLRNVAVSYPYMHDGRISTLEKVLEHYNSGIKISPTLDPLLVNGIPLSDQDKSDIISFLHTLTDYTFLKNPRFSEVN